MLCHDKGRGYYEEFYLKLTVFEFVLSKANGAPEEEYTLYMFPCNSDIVLYARQIAEDKGINLTPMSCAFYVKLFRLVQQEGEKSPDSEMHKIQYSYSQLAKKLHFSYKVVCNSMQLFLKSGLIEREAVSSKAYITYMNISVWDEV